MIGYHEERVVSDWTWQAYDDHGPWDAQLGEPLPSHGWRRVVVRRLGPVVEIEIVWYFGRLDPASEAACDCRQIHAVREAPPRRVA